MIPHFTPSLRGRQLYKGREAWEGSFINPKDASRCPVSSCRRPEEGRAPPSTARPVLRWCNLHPLERRTVNWYRGCTADKAMNVYVNQGFAGGRIKSAVYRIAPVYDRWDRIDSRWNTSNAKRLAAPKLLACAGAEMENCTVIFAVPEPELIDANLIAETACTAQLQFLEQLRDSANFQTRPSPGLAAAT